MSQDQQVPLTGDWYVYRYNISRYVLKAPETTLKIMALKESQEDYTALFELSGFDKKVKVEMILDRRTASWYGEEGSIDFRWERVENRGTIMLIGHASDRTNIAYRDFFIAVQSRRTDQLPWPPPNRAGIYQFGPSYETFLQKNKSVHAGSGISVTEAEITFDGKKYKSKEPEPYKRGLKLVGEYEEAGLLKKIWLWMLPLDATKRLLATGYHYETHYMGDPTLPGDQHCTGGHSGG